MSAGRGWQTSIPPGRWDEHLAFYERAVTQGVPLQYMVEIVRSVISSGRADHLGATTSHFDLIVAAQPADSPPFDVIVVRTLAGLRPPKDGHVRVEHQSLTGHDDSIERPSSEAVRLFWRFVISKFGIEPDPRPLEFDALTRDFLVSLLAAEPHPASAACLDAVRFGATIRSGDDGAAASVEELLVIVRRRLAHVKEIDLPALGFEEAVRALELTPERRVHLGVVEGQREWFTVVVSEDYQRLVACWTIQRADLPGPHGAG